MKPTDDTLTEVNHKDKIRTNNKLPNLQWMNHIDNCAHRDANF